MHIYTITAETQEDLKPYVRGPEYFSALNEVVNFLRGNAKHNNGEITWEDVYDEVLRILKDHNVDPFEG